MNYNLFSTSVLKEFHKVIQNALEYDDRIPHGQPKRYGVREFPDWKEELIEIESELKNRKESFIQINLSSNISVQPETPIQVEKLLYERIRECLEYDDLLSPGVPKTYGVREFSDWKKCAKELENEMNNKRIPFIPINW